MELTQIKHVIEAALLAAGRPLPLDKLASLFAARASELDKDTLRGALEALAVDYNERGLELKEVASGYRIQIKSSMTDWLTPLWEERAPRYTRALLETLALIAYRQPITRAEIEEVRGVVVSTNIVRTLLERNWIRVVGHRDVPGKPAMFGTTRDFLDYFGLKKLEDLPTLAEIKDGLPEESPQADLIEALTSIEGSEGEALEDDEPELDAAEVSAVIAQAGEVEEEDEEVSALEDEVAASETAECLNEAIGELREPDDDLAGEPYDDGAAEADDDLADEADEDLGDDDLADEADEDLGDDDLADEADEDLADDHFTDDAEDDFLDESEDDLAEESEDLADRDDEDLEDDTGEDVALRRS